jgi:anti-sigma B factor antagonist
MSEDAQGFRTDTLHIEARQDRAAIIMSLVGEFDMTGTERFWSFLSEALAADLTSVTVDASGLEFIDSSGLMALVRARASTVDAGVGFHLRNPCPALRRIVELCGLEELLAPDVTSKALWVGVERSTASRRQGLGDVSSDRDVASRCRPFHTTWFGKPTG